MENPLPREVYLKRTHLRQPDVRGDYFRDQTAIIHSMPFRRLKHKTQVFFAPENDHVCTRIEHVMHVATIAATICKGLNSSGWNLDAELAYATGLGHDLGHAPFGHSGEEILNQKLQGIASFIHEVNGYRVVEHLANGGRGLNLTYGVKDGIINHNGEQFEQYLRPVPHENRLEAMRDRNSLPSSYEGCIVRFADKIAYLGRDIEDAKIAGFIRTADIPEQILKELGTTNGEIINSLVIDVIESSRRQGAICFSDEKFEVVERLIEFNRKYIYNHPKIEAYKVFGQRIIAALFDYLMESYRKYGRDYPKYSEGSKLERAFGKHLEEMDQFYQRTGAPPELMVTDYVAGMTDLYALECMKQITLPAPIQFQ
ncbi:dGTPase [Hydrogenispora ethanolica]|jgi:dGTPase|uniref:dGTPase n=1 Tax=Hydrogenispora ethanolica TaxID=1082276 RepID=A0A4R1RR51_HYDET|nr:HD domain-containing protein [Hydrogenispora ethanolica]TCL68490.1 dGTPase [Hydrogenispora ethanolica]